MKKTTNTPSTSERLLHSLLRASGLLRHVQDIYFAKNGVSSSQWGILRVLQRAELRGETGLPLKEISERVLVRPPSVTGVVDRLERLGLVKRSASTNDLRVRHLGLTSQGRDLLARVLERHPERIDFLLEPLDAEERRTFVGFLERLERHLEKTAVSGDPARSKPTTRREKNGTRKAPRESSQASERLSE